MANDAVDWSGEYAALLAEVKERELERAFTADSGLVYRLELGGQVVMQPGGEGDPPKSTRLRSATAWQEGLTKWAGKARLPLAYSTFASVAKTPTAMTNIVPNLMMRRISISLRSRLRAPSMSLRSRLVARRSSMISASASACTSACRTETPAASSFLAYANVSNVKVVFTAPNVARAELSRQARIADNHPHTHTSTHFRSRIGGTHI